MIDSSGVGISNNTNNLSRISNYKVFLPILDETIRYAQGITFPGFNLNPIPAYNHASMRLWVEGDNLEMDPITISLIVDENYALVKQILKIFENVVHPTNGTKGLDYDFNCGIEITNNTGNPLFAIEFYRCALQSVAPINLLSNSEDDIIVIDLTFNPSYYEITDYLNPDKLKEKIIKSWKVLKVWQFKQILRKHKKNKYTKLKEKNDLSRIYSKHL